ncbi:protease inhibitor I9 family protein, partial [Kitasatospora indigofera]|uniref:protease inhibitor I9 family protein n=1 Tax=Kitasatospora indigofera TaxID=67307 RepID=UPI001E489A19
MKRTAISAGLVLAAVAGFGAVPATAQGAGSAEQQPARYLVVLQDGTAADPVTVAGSAPGVRLGSVYRSALSGFSADLTPGAVRALRADPAVKYVEASAVGHADGQEVPNGAARAGVPGNAGLKAGDGLDQRVDVDVAVIDSG